MKKILCIFGTRPEIIKFVPLIKEFQKYPKMFDTKICVTGQHRKMLDQMLNAFSIKPDYDLDIMKNNQSLFDITNNVLSEIKKVLEKEKPDMVLVQGDTTTAFIAALSSFYLKIKVGHIEAGLRTFDIYNPFPEEMNRRLISNLSSIHLAPTEKNKQNLLAEGIKKEKIFVTGNTGIDTLFITLEKLKEDKSKLKFFTSQFPFLDSNPKLILVTAHRRENFGEPLKNICLALREIVKNNRDVEIVYPVHLNPNVRRPVKNILKGHKKIHLIEPPDYESFIWLMNISYLILTDAGGIQEEAPSLGKPVLVLRETSERPEAVESGVVKVIGTDKDRIISSVQLLLDNFGEYRKMAKTVNPYGDGKASKRIVKILKDRI